jgi:hypothetical protein
VCVCVRACGHAGLRVYVYIHVGTLFLGTVVYACGWLHACTRECACACVHVSVCISLRVCVLYLGGLHVHVHVNVNACGSRRAHLDGTPSRAPLSTKGLQDITKYLKVFIMCT